MPCKELRHISFNERSYRQIITLEFQNVAAEKFSHFLKKVKGPLGGKGGGSELLRRQMLEAT